MKSIQLTICFVISIFLLINCSQKSTNEKPVTDSLSTSYVPHLGQMMLTTQQYHAKLYYAGNSQNWELSDFYVHELMESMEDIMHFYPEYEGLKIKNSIEKMAIPELDSLTVAIQQKSASNFQKHFLLLTNQCNSCHQANKHGFIKIKLPEKGDYLNQEFKR